jgi:hypothetical protein
MDKAQKQLIDTYFRKRKIANDLLVDDEDEMAYNDVNQVNYTDYELYYGMNHDLINFNETKKYISGNKLYSLLSKHPELINELHSADFILLGEKNFINLISKNPKLADTDEVIKYLSEYGVPQPYLIHQILLRQPKFVNTKFFQEASTGRIHSELKWDYRDIDTLYELLYDQPALMHYPFFAERLNALIKHEPDLMKQRIQTLKHIERLRQKDLDVYNEKNNG